MNKVGTGGKGESVWMGWFLRVGVLQEVCAARRIAWRLRSEATGVSQSKPTIC